MRLDRKENLSYLGETGQFHLQNLLWVLHSQGIKQLPGSCTSCMCMYGPIFDSLSALSMSIVLLLHARLWAHSTQFLFRKATSLLSNTYIGYTCIYTQTYIHIYVAYWTWLYTLTTWTYLWFILREADEIAVLDHNKKEWWTVFQIVVLAAPSEGEVAALTFLDPSL